MLAEQWSDTRVVLLDARLARVAFLRAAVASLGWSARVETIHDRAEEFGRHPTGRERFEIVVARAFGPPAITAECGAPLVEADGCLLVSEPVEAGDRWPAEHLDELGLIDDGVGGTETAHIRRLRKVRPLDDRFPRRPAAMQRRPLWR